MRRPRFFSIAPCTLLAALVVPPAVAQQANLTLVPEVAVWNEPIEARIDGIGCSGAHEAPVTITVGGQRIIDIDLHDCSASSTQAFSIRVPLGPLFPDEYLVRAQDSIRNSGMPSRITPPPFPFDEAPLSVRDLANATLELPHSPTDEGPVTITAIVPSSSPCFQLDGPHVADGAIEIYFDGSCPILPPGGPGIYRTDLGVGTLAAGSWEVRLFEWREGYAIGRLPMHRRTLVVHDANACVPSDTTLCLGGGRFRVTATWRDFSANTGVGHARPLDGAGASGLVWFFSPENVELTVKALDGCGVNGHWWFFLASGSTVDYTVTVTDRLSGAQRVYTNPAGYSAPLVSDTSAFACGL